jgi:phosphomannomutase
MSDDRTHGTSVAALRGRNKDGIGQRLDHTALPWSEPPIARENAMTELTCFKAYDIRGRLGVDLDTDIARRIGGAFARALGATRVVVGRDCRASSEELMAAVVAGLVDAGVEVLDLGLCGTEEMYFATTHFDADGGIEVTASHNPMDYNGMKLVRRGSAPLDTATGLAAIKALAEQDTPQAATPGGRVRAAEGARAAYVERVLSFVDVPVLPALTVLVNAGNGTAGPTFDAIADTLAARGSPLRFIRMHHTPDGTFPNGIPNPLLPENQPVTGDAVVAHKADMGVAWDGDFDRCFLFDATGRFIPGEYIVGLLAAAFLAKEPGATIIHDPRVIWNTRDIVVAAGGRAVQARTGHAFLKQALRDTGAVYGGEMSAHHYFREFMACDSGMIPWLLVAELIGRSGKSLAQLVSDRMVAFPSSGEINFVCADADAAIARVEAALAPQNPERDEMDGLSLAFPDWRLNLRRSNTEPLLRLNVEARGQTVDLAALVARLRALVDAA